MKDYMGQQMAPGDLVIYHTNGGYGYLQFARVTPQRTKTSFRFLDHVCKTKPRYINIDPKRALIVTGIPKFEIEALKQGVPDRATAIACT